MRRILSLSLTLSLSLALTHPAGAESVSNEELARRVDVLTQEIEALRLGAPADTAALSERSGLAPGAARVYGAPRGVSVGGYGEMRFERPDRFREDDAPARRPARVDLLRLVTYIGYRFSDELLFDSEVEFEHAGVSDEAEVSVDTGTGAGAAELSGEAVVEFAFLDWSARPEIGVRAGLLLVPVGFTNEMHEPPTVIGTRRPEVDRLVIPTTWSAGGAGIYGELPGGLAYRAYVVEGLDASGFSAASGIRGGRQSGSQALATHAAFTGRADWTAIPGLTLGASVFTGNAWQRPQPGGPALSPVLTLWETHARWRARGLEARALWASGTLTGASELSDALALSGNERLGSRLFGGYAEAVYDALPLASPGTRWGLGPYARYETWSTQDEVDAAGAENPSNRRRALTVGVVVRPHPAVALELEREMRSSEADDETGGWNVALGYQF